MNETLPPREEMVAAYLAKDASYDGLFYVAVKTTGIFCRPVCPARKPFAENVEFFASARNALFSGYGPCKRCRPMEALGTPPPWLRDLLKEVEAEPERKWRDRDLRALGLAPDRVRRWFRTNHGMTFHAYGRARRLGLALGRIQEGKAVIMAAYDHGYESLSGFNEAFRGIVGTTPRNAKTAFPLTIARIPARLGPMIACASDDALYLLEFADRRGLEKQMERLRSLLNAIITPGDNAILRQTGNELESYFAGDRHTFSIPIETPGTPFQRTVWERLCDIGYGATRSYREIAEELGNPGAVRAVARANGANRLAIIIPCHRVIGADGSLTGYAGGLHRKRKLLELEGGVLSLG